MKVFVGADVRRFHGRSVSGHCGNIKVGDGPPTAVTVHFSTVRLAAKPEKGMSEKIESLCFPSGPKIG
jgi:hypothetical protein